MFTMKTVFHQLKDAFISKIVIFGALVCAHSVAFALDDALPRTNEELELIDDILSSPNDFSQPEKYEQYPSGATTNQQIFNEDVFSQPLANLNFTQEIDFRLGNGFFRTIWTEASQEPSEFDGLGPLFNASSCHSCHVRDGRGRASLSDDGENSLLLRLGQKKGEGEAIADPIYGHQLQDRAINAMRPEGQIRQRFEDSPITLSDGLVVTLRKPIFEIETHSDPLAQGTRSSPRIAQQMIGLGLIEAISEADILSHADPEDQNEDGISGRPNMIWSQAKRATMLGRFGHQATQATLIDQVASAFFNDMGLVSRPFQGVDANCTAEQRACAHLPNGQDSDGLEVTDNILNLITFYSQTLAVPERKRFEEPEVLRGKAVFYSVGCQGCHVPKYVTQRFKKESPFDFQLIWPYSDFLLHDMGEGLASGFGEGVATQREWRTAPLWGIGHTRTVSGEENYLHDGRARNLLEAILWHGGEAAPHQKAVVALSKSDREALLTFLKSM